MLDSHLHPRLKPLLNAVAGALDRPGISPDGLTLVGFAIGVLALPFLALGWYGAALAAILLNRLLDGWTALWRGGAGSRTRAAFSILRWIFSFTPGAVRLYSGGSAEQCHGGRLAAVCLYRHRQQLSRFCRHGGGHQIANPGYAHKSLYYLGGLTEGTETILLFVLGCLFPAHFAWLAWLFGALCWLTTATRICSGYQTLKRVTTTA